MLEMQVIVIEKKKKILKKIDHYLIIKLNN